MTYSARCRGSGWSSRARPHAVWDRGSGSRRATDRNFLRGFLEDGASRDSDGKGGEFRRRQDARLTPSDSFSD